MAKHIYDEDGNYKGKILSDEEHDRKQGEGVDPDEFSFLDRFLAKKFGKEKMAKARGIFYSAFLLLIFLLYLLYG